MMLNEIATIKLMASNKREKKCHIMPQNSKNSQLKFERIKTFLKQKIKIYDDTLSDISQISNTSDYSIKTNTSQKTNKDSFRPSRKNTNNSFQQKRNLNSTPKSILRENKYRSTS